jgi:DNA excision repair protein ERCC-6
VLKRFELRTDGFYFYSASGDFVLDPFTETAFFVESRVFPKLYPHQVECLKWLWKLHKENTGGILGGLLGLVLSSQTADDMGLGKTVQIASMLGSLVYSELIKAVLVIVPKSLISHWESECKKWYVAP